jgi:hypothetical protein
MRPAAGLTLMAMRITITDIPKVSPEHLLAREARQPEVERVGARCDARIVDGGDRKIVHFRRVRSGTLDSTITGDEPLVLDSPGLTIERLFP